MSSVPLSLVGAYSEYLNHSWTPADLDAERKIQLKRISKLRGNRDRPRHCVRHGSLQIL